MPKYTPPTGLVEPIEFKLDGKLFVIPKITQKMVADASVIEKDAKPIEIIEIFVGPDVRETDPDVRELTSILGWLSEQINTGLGGAEKNAPAPSPESPSPSQDYLNTVT